jgi:hypothetical protein
MTSHQIFNDSFETIWKDFDTEFRDRLLKTIGQLGSLHRLSLGPEELNTEYSRRFYEALEETLASGKFIAKWKKALVIPLPTNFDELTEVFRHHAVYPLHAFYLLVTFVSEHPLHGFFSGRDVQLPFNTLTLQFHQSLADPLPTRIDYELEMVQLDRCPWLAYDHKITPAQQSGNGGGSGSGNPPKPHPQHHWRDLFWVWHFDLGGGLAAP